MAAKRSPTVLTAGTGDGNSDDAIVQGARIRQVHVFSVVVLLVGFVVTAGLAFASASNYNRTERRLLKLDTSLTGSSLSSSASSIESRLFATAEVGALSDGNVAKFSAYAKSEVSGTKGWATVSLWKLGTTPRLLVRLGNHPLLSGSTGRLAALFALASHSPTFAVTELSSGTEVRLGYAYAVEPAGYGVYAESVLPASRKLQVATASPISQLHYALYLGRTERFSNLLAADDPSMPPSGLIASSVTPFGTSELTLIMSPRVSLAGNLAAALPWVIGGVGVVFTLLVAMLCERLIRRRDRAEALAAENQRLFRAQRSVAEVLQHSLLPQHLPAPRGLEFAARYVPGVEGIDIGGDWYDVLELSGGRYLFAVGDVSGRGLQAATLMASLRYAIHAYAMETPEPDIVLTKLTKLIDLGRDGHFATILCGLIDPSSATVSIANAGHPVPLLVGDGDATLIETVVGPPVGVLTSPTYVAVEVPTPPGSTLVAYTDGLIERRDEPLSTGLERLRRAAAGTLPIEGLLDQLLATLVPEGSSDDLAILGVRWQN